MKRLLTAACVLAGLTSLATAQTSTPSAPPSPPSTPSGQSGGTDSQAALKRVDGAALVLAFYTADPADVRATKLIGTNVYNLNNESIGEVNDLVIDNGKTIKAVIVSVGGFLGMGERNVAISPGSMVMSEQRDGSFRLVVNTTREDLKKAAPFNFADVDKPGPNAGKAPDGAPAKK